MSTNTTIHNQTSIYTSSSTSTSTSSSPTTIGGVPLATLFTYLSLPDLAHAISTCHTWYIVLTAEERELLPQLHQWNRFVSTWENETSFAATWKPYITEADRHQLPQHHPWNRVDDRWRDAYRTCYMLPSLQPQQKHHIWNHVDRGIITDTMFANDAIRHVNVTYTSTSTKKDTNTDAMTEVDVEEEEEAAAARSYEGESTSEYEGENENENECKRDNEINTNVTSPSSTSTSTIKDKHQHDTNAQIKNFQSQSQSECRRETESESDEDETYINVISTSATTIEETTHQHDTDVDEEAEKFESQNQGENDCEDDDETPTIKSFNKSKCIPTHDYVHSPHTHPIWLSSLPQVQYPSSAHEYNASHPIYGMYKTKNKCDQTYLLLLPRCSDRSIPVGCGRFYRIDEYFHNEDQAAHHYSGIWFRSPDNHLIRLIYETKYCTGITYPYWISNWEPESYVYTRHEEEKELYEFHYQTLCIIHPTQHQHQQQYTCTGPILLTHSHEFFQRYHPPQFIPIPSHDPYGMIHSPHMYNHPINDLHMLHGNMTWTHPFIECIGLLNPSAVQFHYNAADCVCDPHVVEDDEAKQRRIQSEQRRRCRYQQMR